METPPWRDNGVLSSPDSVRSQVVLNHFWGRVSIMGGGVTWVEQKKAGKARSAFRDGGVALLGPVLPPRATRGALLGLGKAGNVATAVVQLWLQKIQSAAPWPLPYSARTGLLLFVLPPSPLLAVSGTDQKFTFPVGSVFTKQRQELPLPGPPPTPSQQSFSLGHWTRLE